MSARSQTSDTYIKLVNSGLTKKIASALGLPRPAILRRTNPNSIDHPLTGGTVVLIGAGASTDQLAEHMLGWDLDVRRHVPSGKKIAAIVVDLSDAASPEQVSERVLKVGALLRSLRSSSRVITVSRATSADQDPALAATQFGVQAITRSLAKEMRAGGTANGIVMGEGVSADAISVAGALRFFLSARSAFVSGQFLEVSTADGAAPANWAAPLEGRVAVVTGAARGIGAAIARTLARDGAHVIGVDMPAGGWGLAQVMNEVRGTALQLDVTAKDAAAKIMDLARQRYGRLDIVIHNAGITRDKLLANMSQEKWDQVVAVNLAAQLQMNEDFLDAAGSELTPAGLRLVSLASTSGIAGNRGQTNYAFTKAGAIAMNRSLAKRLAAASSTANSVAPGFIETDMTAAMPTLTRQVARRLNSLQQGGLPVDVAEAIAFLVSPQAGGISGQALRVCGQNMVGA